MKRLRVVVADDEPLARGMVRDLLDRDSELEVVGEAGDGDTALRLIRDRRPDIAFLDVEMPERGGLEVVASLASEAMPAVVFVTAYSLYATEAFERAAIDYVVKPFADDRFFAALGRAKQRVREKRLIDMAERFSSLAGELSRKAGPEAETNDYLRQIPVQRGDRTLILEAENVIWIESQDYYARLHTAERSFLVRASLTSFEKRLDPNRFLRVHRQAVVNLRHVSEVEHLIKGALALVLSNGTRCPVSRARRAAVSEVLLPKLRG